MGPPSSALEYRQRIGRVLQHRSGGDHAPRPRMSGRQRVAGRVLRRRDEFARRRSRTDPPAPLDDRPAGQAKYGGERVPRRAFGTKAPDLGVLSLGPDELPGHATAFRTKQEHAGSYAS